MKKVMFSLLALVATIMVFSGCSQKTQAKVDKVVKVGKASHSVAKIAYQLGGKELFTESTQKKLEKASVGADAVGEVHRAIKEQ